MKMRIVIDTNVLISAFLFPKSKPVVIYQMAKKSEFELFLSLFIFDEFTQVLKQKFGVSDKKISRQIRRFQKFTIIVPLMYNVAIIKDASDNHVLETAMKARADYLITGDKQHILPLKRIESTLIVSPAEFLSQFNKNVSEEHDKELARIYLK